MPYLITTGLDDYNDGMANARPPVYLGTVCRGLVMPISTRGGRAISLCDSLSKFCKRTI
jgi:hypothetical protein